VDRRLVKLLDVSVSSVPFAFLAPSPEEVNANGTLLMKWADPLQWSLHHHMNTPTYYNGLICLLGDSAHATTPHQASGAGQCIEDALVLSHILGRVTDAKQLPAAFQAYDAIRRPRAQKVVRTSQEAGQLYSFTHPKYGEDMTEIVKNFNERYTWIWEHDLQGDLDKGEVMFTKLAGGV
jgi:salicylate hydroxylase